MRNRALVAYGVVIGLGLGSLMIAAVSTDRRLAFTLGVTPAKPVVTLARGGTVCQSPVDVAAGFSRILLYPGTFRRPGPPLGVRVLEQARAPLAAGRLAGGYADNAKQVVTVGNVGAGRSIAVCVRNLGSRPVALYGDGAGRGAPLHARVRGRSIGADLSIEFLRRRSISTLDVLPTMLARASRFRAGWFGPWTLWLVAVAVLLVVPASIAMAVRGSGSAGEG